MGHPKIDGAGHPFGLQWVVDPIRRPNVEGAICWRIWITFAAPDLDNADCLYAWIFLVVMFFRRELTCGFYIIHMYI